MTNPFKDQKEFMEAAGQRTSGVGVEQSCLYLDLIQEEYTEFARAPELSAEDVKEAVDMLVVTIGYLYSIGVDAEEAWRRVHASNMSKLVDGKLIKREDGKVLKPDTYKPPVLDDLLPLEGA